MFYENQPVEQKENYKNMLKIMGKLSKLFSESNKPYLYYRCHENIFCKYFDAENLSREDCSADAKKGNMGIGLKTWIDADNQKVAEFNKLKNTYMNLPPYEMVCKIAEYRNERIRVTKNIHGINQMIYHIIKRIPNAMQIYEYAFELIDIQNIKLENKGEEKNNIYFNDGKHEYHFNISKSTLYMTFTNMILLDSFEVDILEDPYGYLESLAEKNILKIPEEIQGKDFLDILHNNISNMEVQQVIIMYIQDLLVGISNIIDIFEPEAISIGGGFAYYKDILYNKLLEEFYNRKYVFNKNSLPEIKLASLGNDAGIIGAVIN